MQITQPQNSRRLTRLLRQVAATSVRIGFAHGFSSTYARCRQSNLRAIQRVKNQPGKYNDKLSAMWKGN